MKKNTFINATLFILAGVMVITIVMMVLVGENGIIKKAIKDYNDTHVEERYEKEEKNIVVEE